MKWFRDLFYGPGNYYLDLARLLAAAAVAAELGGELWNIHLHQTVELGALGGGLAAILTASAGYVAAKQWAATQHQLGESLRIKREMRDQGDGL